MADEADYITTQAGHHGYLVVRMTWQAHRDDFEMLPLAGPLPKKQAVSVALEEARRLGLDYRR